MESPWAARLARAASVVVQHGRAGSALLLKRVVLPVGGLAGGVARPSVPGKVIRAGPGPERFPAKIPCTQVGLRDRV